MRNTRRGRARMLPVVTVPAVMPAILLPVLMRGRVPDAVMGTAMGICIGLAVIGIVWMVRADRWCARGE